MEVRKGKNGKRLWSVEQKKLILGEIDEGLSPAEVARKYDIPLHTIYRWRNRFQEGGDAALKSNQEMVSISEMKRLEAEKKDLQRALGEMTMERNILRDAVEVGRKKKWIWGGR